MVATSWMMCPARKLPCVLQISFYSTTASAISPKIDGNYNIIMIGQMLETDPLVRQSRPRPSCKVCHSPFSKFSIEYSDCVYALASLAINEHQSTWAHTCSTSILFLFFKCMEKHMKQICESSHKWKKTNGRLGT